MPRSRTATAKEVRAAFQLVFYPKPTAQNDAQRYAASLVVKQLRHEAGCELKSLGARVAGYYDDERTACYAAGKRALYHRILWWANLTDEECERMSYHTESYLDELPE